MIRKFLHFLFNANELDIEMFLNSNYCEKYFFFGALTSKIRYDTGVQIQKTSARSNQVCQMFVNNASHKDKTNNVSHKVGHTLGASDRAFNAEGINNPP